MISLGRRPTSTNREKPVPGESEILKRLTWPVKDGNCGNDSTQPTFMYVSPGYQDGWLPIIKFKYLNNYCVGQILSVAIFNVKRATLLYFYKWTACYSCAHNVKIKLEWSVMYEVGWTDYVCLVDQHYVSTNTQCIFALQWLLRM